MYACFVRVGEIPFSSERKLMSTAHADGADGCTTLFVKGAPDVLLARCRAEQVGDAERLLSDARRHHIQHSIDALADQALRTLGLAYRLLPPDANTALHPGAEEDLVWLGVAGMIDPPRPEAAAAVRAAQNAGVRVIMITGDHPRSAAVIAQELGISTVGGRAMTGAEIEAASDVALGRCG